jgi:UDP-N-acetylglucosamine pyrophosphorylase
MDPKVEFVRGILRAAQPETPPAGAVPPARFLDARLAQPEYTEAGLQLLRRGKVAALMVAGGMSTRMGLSMLRGNLRIGPVTARTIFCLHGETIAALQKRFALHLPWLVMTSAAVHDATVSAFQKELFFGVTPEDVWFFQQATLPVLDSHLNPIPLPDGAYLESPTGHGGMLAALSASGALHKLKERGVEYLFHFQYPNVLERICDPVMLGYHQLGGYEATTKAVCEYSPSEKMGRCVVVGQALQVVEYYALTGVPPDSWWHAVPASIGTHVWSLAFLERCLAAGVQLPYHPAPHHGMADVSGPLRKVEQFVFDLLPYAAAGLMITERADEYAPVKSMIGEDSLEAGQRSLARMYCKWLDQAGAQPESATGADCRVEISPHYALGAADLAGRLPRDFRYRDGLVLV